MSGKKYDVFLSHHRDDKPVVQALAEKLLHEGIKPFLDRWHLIPGDPWQEALERALEDSETCAVFLGPHGLGTWANEEMRVALERRAGKRMSRVFAVLLPGSSVPDNANLPSFLSSLTWVDLRSGWEKPEDFRQLLCGIRGVASGPPSPPGLPRSAVEPNTDSSDRLDRSPYRGMVHFRTEDADLFYGRDALTKFLVKRLRDRDFLAVVGPSGSGKSSLVRAGLIPALRKGDLSGSTTRSIVLLKPGDRPLRELAARLLHLVDPELSLDGFCEAMKNSSRTLAAEVRRAAQAQILLIIDQFEEIFTQTSPEERRAFLANLIDALSLMPAKLTVIVILRADFYASVAAYPDLADRVAARQVIVTPMRESELWEAITEPATRFGLSFEAGLVDEILRDMRDQTGALALLQQALRELWERRDGNTLTAAAYKESRGVKGAIAGWAESVYAPLSIDQQSIVRRILVRLVQPGEIDTRRRIAERELVLDSPRASEIESVLEHLIQKRLLTTDRDFSTGENLVEISHEALLHEWPRLRKWLEESRAFRLINLDLQARVTAWESLGREAGSLLRGAELEKFERWYQDENEKLSPSQQQYLEASIENRRIEMESQELLKRLLAQQPPSLVFFNGVNLQGEYLTPPMSLKKVIKKTSIRRQSPLESGSRWSTGEQE